MYKLAEWEVDVNGDCISCTWISDSETFRNNLSFLCRLFLLCCHPVNCICCGSRSHFLLFQASSGTDNSITGGARKPYGSAKGFCSLLWITPTHLSKLASFKGSANISAQHEHSADMPLQKRSVFVPSLMLQQIYRSEQNSYMTKNFQQYGLVESRLIVLIQLWGQFYDSHQFFCNMTFNDIWVLKFHLQENCHGKEPESNEWL